MVLRGSHGEARPTDSPAEGVGEDQVLGQLDTLLVLGYGRRVSCRRRIDPSGEGRRLRQSLPEW